MLNTGKSVELTSDQEKNGAKDISQHCKINLKNEHNKSMRILYNIVYVDFFNKLSLSPLSGAKSVWRILGSLIGAVSNISGLVAHFRKQAQRK